MSELYHFFHILSIFCCLIFPIKVYLTKFLGVVMFTYIKNIENPAFKCFMQIFPFFVAFFVLKDWGTEIWNGITYFFNNSSTIMMPLFKKAGDYILGALVFFSIWSIFIFSNIINSNTAKDKISIVSFWKNISHLATIILLMYTVSYIMYNTDVYQAPANFLTDIRDTAFGTLVCSYIICALIIAFNIYLFVKMHDLKKEDKEDSYY